MQPFTKCHAVLAALLFSQLLDATTLFAAAPTLTYLFPAGTQHGQSVTVKFGGKLVAGDRVWCSRTDVDCQVADDAKSLTVTVKQGARPGLCWLRAYNNEGSSDLRPFVIGSLPEISEAAANDSIRQSHALPDQNQIVNGRLEKSGDVDVYSIPLKAGQTLVASVDAKRTPGSPMDAVLQVLSPRGVVLEQNDDDHGMDPQIVLRATEDATYFVRIFAFPAAPNSTIAFAGAETYVYRLTLTTGPFLDHAVPLAQNPEQQQPLQVRGWNIAKALEQQEPSGEAGEEQRIRSADFANTFLIRTVHNGVKVETAASQSKLGQLVQVPVSITGHIAKSQEVDRYRLQAKKGTKLVLECLAREVGSPLDPVVTILNAEGKVLSTIDDISRGKLDCRTTYSIPADGEYEIQVTDRFEAGGFRFCYLLSVHLPRADFALTVAKNAFNVDAGGKLEIEVTIDRQNGFAEPIEVRAETDAKADIKSVTSAPKGDTAKKVKLVVMAESLKDYRGPLRIMARNASNAKQVRRATAAIANHDQRTTHLWLTALPAKKDKK